MIFFNYVSNESDNLQRGAVPSLLSGTALSTNKNLKQIIPLATKTVPGGKQMLPICVIVLQNGTRF